MEQATLTCPQCLAKAVKAMPDNRSEIFFDCSQCGTKHKAKPGVCCVFCSYGDKRCKVSVLNNPEGQL
jgi:hypothetical protein